MLEFYTYSFDKTDLHIHHWFHSHRNDDGLDVYYNEAHDKETTCVPYDDESEFCRENDVYADRLQIILDLTEVFRLDDIKLVLDE